MSLYIKTPKIIQVFEYDVLRVGQQGFSKNHFEQLAIYHEERQSPFFSLGHNAIRFSSFVGESTGAIQPEGRYKPSQ